jgi:hypothetical protein
MSIKIDEPNPALGESPPPFLSTPNALKMNTATAQTAQAVETAQAQAQPQAVETAQAQPAQAKTMEYKERQWLGYWASAHGDSEPYNGHEKKLWWRQTFGEDYTVPVTWNDMRKEAKASQKPVAKPLSLCMACGDAAEDDLPYCSFACECHSKYLEDVEWQEAKKAQAQAQSKGH